jgi:hypothetical protein
LVKQQKRNSYICIECTGFYTFLYAKFAFGTPD